MHKQQNSPESEPVHDATGFNGGNNLLQGNLTGDAISRAFAVLLIWPLIPYHAHSPTWYDRLLSKLFTWKEIIWYAER